MMATTERGTYADLTVPFEHVQSMEGADVRVNLWARIVAGPFAGAEGLCVVIFGGVGVDHPTVTIRVEKLPEPQVPEDTEISLDRLVEIVEGVAGLGWAVIEQLKKISEEGDADDIGKEELDRLAEEGELAVGGVAYIADFMGTMYEVTDDPRWDRLRERLNDWTEEEGS